MNELCELMKDIASRPLLKITQIDNLHFKIELYGKLMESYMRLGDIQEEINTTIGDKYEFKTIYGDKQDAEFIFKLK